MSARAVSASAASAASRRGVLPCLKGELMMDRVGGQGGYVSSRVGVGAVCEEEFCHTDVAASACG